MLYLQSEQILKELPASSRVARNLNVLLKISRVVHSIRDLEELQEQILKLIFEVVPAERGANILDDKGDEHFASVFARHRIASPCAGSHQPHHCSSGDERRVGDSRSRRPSSSNLAGVESLVDSQVRSLLCVPLTMFQKVTGCIYLDTRKADARFDEDHLQLVAAIAGTSAVALENARRNALAWSRIWALSAGDQCLEHNLIGGERSMKEVYQFLARGGADGFQCAVAR